jgi:hypothetical protein
MACDLGSAARSDGAATIGRPVGVLADHGPSSGNAGFAKAIVPESAVIRPVSRCIIELRKSNDF